MKRIVAPMMCALFVVLQLSGAALAGAPEALTLKEAIGLALEQNPSLEGKRREADAAHGDVISARAAFLPRIGGSADIRHYAHDTGITIPANAMGNPNKMSLVTGERTVPAVTAGIEQTLYDFGRSTHRYRAAKIGEEVQRMRTDLFAQDLTLETVRNYFGVIVARRAVVVARSAATALAEHSATANKFFNAGAVARNDLLAADVARSRADLEVDAAKNRVAIAELEFEKVVGVPPEHLDESSFAYRPSPGDRQTEIAAARERRLEMQVVDGTARLAKEEKAAAGSEYMPRLVAEAQASYQDDDYLLTKDQYRFVAGVRWPIFDGLSAYGKRRKADAQMLAAASSRRVVADQIDVEATQSSLDIEHAAKAVQVAETNIRKTEENLRINRERYAAGGAPATDVLDAIAAWNEAGYERLQALYDYHLAVARFRRATGQTIAGE